MLAKKYMKLRKDFLNAELQLIYERNILTNELKKLRNEMREYDKVLMRG